ncbi:MAG TPA: family 16 glycosylhydrolase [Tepidisphaeraceae bacterium]|jgi:beta-glucanase (GH16 family)
MILSRVVGDENRMHGKLHATNRNHGFASKSRLAIYTAEMLEPRRLLSTPPIAAGWSLIFDDEFQGTTLNTNNWSLYLPWTNTLTGNNRYHATNNNYLSYMEPENVTVNNGEVDLTTSYSSTPYFSNSNITLNYSEGMITTASKFTQAYGYIEIRAQLPTGAGNWPAFWMTNGWPPEDDIMEVWPATQTNHQGLYGMNDTWYNVYPSYSNVSSGWHTFALYWQPGEQIFYEDGIATQTITDTSAVPSSSNPEYLLLNSGVQNGQTANYSNSNNNTLRVSSVRAWAYNGPATPALLNPGFEQSGTAFNGSGQPYGGGSVGNYSPRTGKADLRLAGSSGQGDQQTITGLSPNTTYTFSAYAQVDSGNSAYIGVKNYTGGAGQILQSVSSTTWSQSWVTFTTGPSDTSAIVFLYKTTGSGNAYFDDTQFSLGQSTLSAIASQQAAENTAAYISLTIKNYQSNSKPQYISAEVTSSDTSVISPSNITVTYINNQPNLKIIPQTNATGSSTLTVTLLDANGVPTTAQSFSITVATSSTINGATGANNFYVLRDGDNVEVNLNNATVFDEPISSMQLLQLNGNSGDDTFTVDFSGGSPIPSSGLTINGSGEVRGNSALLTGIASSSNITLGNNTITIDGLPITFTSIQRPSLEIASGANVDITAVVGMNTANTLTLDSGSIASLSGSANIPSTTSLVVNGSLSIADSPLTITSLSGAGSMQYGGSLTLGSTANSTFTGTLYGGGSLTKIGSGNLTLGGLPGGAIAVSAGKITLSPSIGLQVATGLSLTSGTTFDLNNNDILVSYSGSSPFSTIDADIQKAYDNGAWNFPGLTSSAAAAAAGSTTSPPFAVAIADTASFPVTEFDSTPITGSAILLKYTTPGDANLDGTVNADDLSLMMLTAAKNPATVNWTGGDFTYQNKLTADDWALTMLSVAYQNAPQPVTVPAHAFSSVISIANPILTARIDSLILGGSDSENLFP